MFLQILVSLYGILRVAIIPSIQELEQVAEYLCTVSAVDFFNYQELRFLSIFPRIDVGVQESLPDELVGDDLFHDRHSVPCHRFVVDVISLHALCGRLVCPDKCGVVAVGMEGSSHHSPSLFPGFRFRLHGMRLSRARSTVEDLLKGRTI